jgi:hypothetical protein
MPRRLGWFLLLTFVLSDCAREGSLPAAKWTFSEVSRAAGIDMRYTFGDDQFSFILEDTGSGAAVIDYDGDGLLDIYFLNGSWVEGVSDPSFREQNSGTFNHLYRNRGDGTFEDVTTEARVGDRGYGMGAAVGDYDGDGDEDLYVLNYGPNVLYRNEGDGTFADVTEAVGVAGPAELGGFLKWSVNAVFVDFDQDRDLDLYVSNYLAFDPAHWPEDMPPEFPYPGPESYKGQASLLYRNDGAGPFEDVTEEAGLLFPGAKSMGVCAGDFDWNGDVDLFEAVDDQGNLLFQNLGDGRFRELAVEAGVAVDSEGKPMAAMHGSVGDIDADGRLDVFVPDLAMGCLYRNLGDWQFEEIGVRAGLGSTLQGSGAWGSHLEDFDNDGDLDLMVVLGGAFDLGAGETDKLFLNDGAGVFTDVSQELGGYFDLVNVSRGAAFADFDNDGDIDFVASRKDVEGSLHLVRNDLSPENHWLTLKLVGTRSNRDGVGTRIALTAGGRVQVRAAFRSGSYLSSNDPRVHFGLGPHAAVERLVIHWPSGTVQEVEVDGVDRVLEVVESQT